jgi:hypothetical protein
MDPPVLFRKKLGERKLTEKRFLSAVVEPIPERNAANG